VSTSAGAPSADDATTQTPPVTPDVSGRARWAWPFSVTVLTFLLALLPPIIGSQSFYRRGDSAAQFLPTWVHFGDLLRGGTWPPLMDPDSWHGGNYAAEALFGIYNPINALNWVFVSLLPDLDLAATLVKAEFLALLALGLYLLCREYGAQPWAASLVAVAMPFSGFTLYWEAGSWASGLIAFTYLPFVWWAFRRTAYGRMKPIWGFLVGALAITQGNPYGVLAVAVVGVAVVVEVALQRDWPGVRRLVLTGFFVALLIPLIFVPLLEIAPLANRGDLAGIRNNDFMSPGLGDLLNLGAPSYLPPIRTFLDPMQVPATYFAWFALPLLPWLRWSSLRGRVRALTAVPLVTVAYFLLAVGPSALWLFRWPLRLVEYVQLPLALLLAVIASAGFHRDKVTARAAASVIIAATGGYLAWAQRPDALKVHAAATALVLTLVAGLVWAILRSARSLLPAVAVVHVGTVLVLCFQLAAYSANDSAARWAFPSDVSAMDKRFASYDGTTLQLANLGKVRARVTSQGTKVWGGLLGGSMYHAVGVDSVNTYSGVGLKAFTRSLCMDYNGGTCPAAYEKLYQPTGDGRPSLATLIKLQTLVVQQGIDQVRPEDGWIIERETKQVVVLHPDEPYPWPDSRLSWASDEVEVTAAETSGAYGETVDIGDVDQAGTLVFARLGWPGYSASIDGEELRWSRTAEGLLQVQIPAGTKAGDVEITYRPPGQRVGLVLGGLGLLGALAISMPVVTDRVGRLRRTSKR